MSRHVRFGIGLLLVISFGLVIYPVFGTVQSVNISPPVSMVGQPITFSGIDIETISPNNPENNIFMHLYLGFGCSFSPSNSIAYTVTSINAGHSYIGSYSTTLSFPAPVAASSQSYSGGWVVASQSYENGLPAGPYSVSVTDTEASINGDAGLCKNFTVVSSSSAAEFSDPVVVICSVLASLLSLLLVLRPSKGTFRTWSNFGRSLSSLFHLSQPNEPIAVLK